MKVLRLIWRIVVVLCQEVYKLGQKYRAYRALKADQALDKHTLEETELKPPSAEQATAQNTSPQPTPSSVLENSSLDTKDTNQSQTRSSPHPGPNPTTDVAQPASSPQEIPSRSLQSTIPLVEAKVKASAAPHPAEMQWTPPGTGVQVQDIVIADGFIYVGQQKAAHDPDIDDPYPFLIDPKLRIQVPKPQQRQSLLGDDWAQSGPVSYAHISPEMRGIFLGWLATGRKDRELPESALRLFLLGIEQRVVSLLSSDRTVDELLALILELERLEVHYAHHTAIVPLIQQLTECCQIQLALSCQPETLLALLPVKQKLSTALKVVIGRCIEQSKAIPMALLWAWYQSSSVAVDLKTPAKRCERAFNFLIQTRGEQQEFAIGADETPPMLPVVYRPFGPSFETEPIAIIKTIDIAELEPQLTILEPLIEACTNDLDAYSRLIGRSPELEGTPAAVALLPQELVFLSGNDQVTAIQTWCQSVLADHSHITIQGEDLLAQWPTAAAGKIRKKEAEQLGQLLAKFGYGYVPDVRYWQTTFNPKHPVILFRLEQLGDIPPSADYPVALMTLELMSCCVITPSESLDADLLARFNLTDSERSRLAAVQQWRRERPLSWKQTCNRIKKLSQEEQFKLAVTLNQQLEQDWQLDDTQYGDLQALLPLPERERPAAPEAEAIATPKELAMSPPPEDAPVLETEVPPNQAEPIETPPAGERESITLTDSVEAPSLPTFTLDTQLIAQRSQESQVASGLLSEIFEEEDPAASSTNAVVEEPVVETEPSDTPALTGSNDLSLGLDEFHWHLLKRIGQKESWERSELEAIAHDQGLLLDGALENINDVAFDQCDEALTEGDDPIEVNDWVYEELQAA